HHDSPQILRSLAIGYIRELRFFLAKTVLNGWVSMKPNSAEALELRGTVWESLSFNSNAILDYKKAVKLAPHRTKARIQLVRLSLASEEVDLEEILDHVNFLYQQDPDRPETLLWLAECKLFQGDLPASRKLLNRLAQEDGDNSRVMVQLAKLELLDGNPAAAEKWARQAIAKEPTERLGYLFLADSLKQQNDPNKKLEAAVQEKRFAEVIKGQMQLNKLLGNDFEANKDN